MALPSLVSLMRSRKAPSMVSPGWIRDISSCQAVGFMVRSLTMSAKMWSWRMPYAPRRRRWASRLYPFGAPRQWAARQLRVNYDWLKNELSKAPWVKSKRWTQVPWTSSPSAANTIVAAAALATTLGLRFR